MHRDISSAPRADFVINTAPTPHAELNGLLVRLVEGVRAALGGTFVAAYLQGSFALGDHDALSDVDVLMVTHHDLSDDQVAALNELHGELHDLANPWAARLEGSYFPKGILKRWSETPRDPTGQPRRPADWADPGTSGRPPRIYPLWFKGNGERGLVRSEHDNTQVVRWVTREKGIVLFGPPARSLIEPVSASALRAEILPLMEEIAGWRGDPAKVDSRWVQAFFVLLACRMAHTLETGAVTTKKVAAEWASNALDPRWRPLIRAAQEARGASHAVKEAPPDPNDVAATFDLFDEMLVRSKAAPPGPDRARDIIARALAQKAQRSGGREGAHLGPGQARGGPRHGQYTPPTMRPGGRGRRG
jgi:hypothetical protein